MLAREMSELVQKALPEVRALDLCAAPGGKSIALAWNGISVTATDFSDQRLLTLKESIQRAAPEVELLSWSTLSKMKQFQWNWVWIDAPCSGTGTLRKNPEARWIRDEKDVRSLQQIQRQLLTEYWEKLPENGFLSYSVCSVLKEEGPFLLDELGLMPFVVKTWSFAPHQLLGELGASPDGFFGALLRKGK